MGSGETREEVDYFRLLTKGRSSFSCCTGGATGLNFLSISVGHAHAEVQDRLLVTGGSGPGTLRMTFLLSGSGKGSGMSVSPRLAVTFIKFDANLFFNRQTPGLLVVDFPFTFDSPLKFSWELFGSIQFIDKLRFVPGEGASASFDYSANLIRVEVLGVPSADVISIESGVHYPTGPQPPVFAAAEGFSCGTTIKQIVNMPLAFEVSASDVDEGNTVTLSAQQLPLGAAMTPPLPKAGNPVASNFSWTPTSAQIGSHELIFSATDNTGLRTSCSARIDVLAEPVIFTPGIGGSTLVSSAGEQFPGLLLSPHSSLSLDPELTKSLPAVTAGSVLRTVSVFSIYTTLLERFTNAGYSVSGPNTNLFPFAYDWRRSNDENADRLRELVQQIRTLYADTKVNIVAHSMGGVLARRYILKSPNDHAVHRLITIASPFLGAPQTINTLETGELGNLNLFITKPGLQTLVEFFPGAHELIPSPLYFTLGGRPLIEEGYDYNSDGITNQEYTPSQLYDALNHRWPRGLPGTNALAFHTINQDNWNQNTVVNTSLRYYHFYGVKAIADTKGTLIPSVVSRRDRRGQVFFSTTFRVKSTLGDGTVPVISARRSGNGFNFNAPNASFRQFVNGDVSHMGLVHNATVLSAVLDTLAEPIEASASFTASTLKTTNTSAPTEPTAAPAYYVSVVGAASVTVADANGNSFDPFLNSGSSGVSDVTSYVTGSDSTLVIFPVEKILSATMVAGPGPLMIEIRKGTDKESSRVIRYVDVEMIAGRKARLHFDGQSVDVLKLDTDENGTFETPVAPITDVTGTAAQDNDPPVVKINSVTQGNAALVTINSSDAASGVKATYYSLDGANFQPYTAPFNVDALHAAVVYAFADDDFANRSSLVTHFLTPQVPQLILTESLSEPAEAVALDSVLFLRDPFPVLSGINSLNPGAGRNTRVIVFLANFQLTPGELASSVVINLIDSNNQNHDIVAEDVRPVPKFQFTQVIFRLPNNLPPGTYTVRVKARGQSSNVGTIRIRI